MTSFRPSFIPAIAWLIISSILLTLPGSSLPSEDWLGKIYFDKWVHIGMFAIMVTAWCWAFLRIYTTSVRLKKTFLWLAVLALCYGVAMEFVQKYCIPNRSFDRWDILADGIGCVVGYLFSSSRYIKK